MRYNKTEKVILTLILCATQLTHAMEERAEAFSLSDALALVTHAKRHKDNVPPLVRLCSRSIILSNKELTTLPSALRPMIKRDRHFLESIATVCRRVDDLLLHTQKTETERVMRTVQSKKIPSPTDARALLTMCLVTEMSDRTCTPELAERYLSVGAYIDYIHLRETFLTDFVVCGLLPKRIFTTLLHEAARYGLVDVLELLLHHNKDMVNSRDQLQTGMTPLHTALEGPRISHIEKKFGRLEPFNASSARNFLDDITRTIELLLDYGADENAQLDDGKIPLELAAQSNLVPLVRVLLDHGADPLQSGTALYHATCSNANLTARFLLEQQKDPVQKCELINKNDPYLLSLAQAFDQKNAELFQLFLESGADPDARYLKVALQLPAENPATLKIAQSLYDAGASTEVPHRSRLWKLKACRTATGRKRLKLEKQIRKRYQTKQAQQQEEGGDDGGEDFGHTKNTPYRK